MYKSTHSSRALKTNPVRNCLVSQGTQTDVVLIRRSSDFSTQTEHSVALSDDVCSQDSDDVDSDGTDDDDEIKDPTCDIADMPSWDESDEDDIDGRRKEADFEREIFEIDDPSDRVFQRKYLVYESCLFLMMAICNICLISCRVYVVRLRGSWARFEARCPKGHCRKFDTQPQQGLQPCGNLAVAACTLFSGSSPAQLLHFFEFMNIAMIAFRTFSRMQRAYVLPAIRNVWKVSQHSLLESLSGMGKKLTVGGDARCCSPGHSAKYSSYSVMDLKSSKILDVQLIQVNEANNSNAMELMGLKRCLAFLLPRVEIASITTDRHPQVQKYLKTDETVTAFSIRHFYDVWHIAKSVKKRIEKQSQQSEYRELLQWKNTVTNHLYWCAATSDGDGAMIVEKWLSILNHVINKHEHAGPRFVSCQHETLPNDYEYMVRGSAPYKALQGIVTDTCLLRDIKKLSPSGQTSSLESYHNIVTFFAPKKLHYFYAAMEGRIYLSALHFNENSARPPALTATGKPRYAASFPKGRGGEAVLKAVPVPTTYVYVKSLLTEVISLRDQYPTYKAAQAAVQGYMDQIPNPVASAHRHMDKDELVASKRTRFNYPSFTDVMALLHDPDLL